MAEIGGFGSVEIGGYLNGDWGVFGFDRCCLWGFVGSSDNGYGGQDILFMSCCAGVDGGRWSWWPVMVVLVNLWLFLE